MQGTGHTRFERTLRRDIAAKNALSDEYRNRIRLAHRFIKSSETAPGRRWQKKYAKTAARLVREADIIRGDVLRRIQDVEARIRQEMQFSEHEVAAFHVQFEKEHREWLDAEKKRQAAAKTLRGLSRKADPPDGILTADQLRSLDEARAAAARTESRARREKKDVERVERELDAEARDKNFFTRELQRIAAERITFS